MFTVILLTIALNSYADTVMRVNADGSISLHNRYYKNGKEVISPFKNQEATARWIANQNRFVGSSTINAPVISGRTGAVSVGKVQATVTQGVSKRVVMGEVLNKARTGGKTFGRLLVGNSPYGRAFNLALNALALSGIVWDDELRDFVKPEDKTNYLAFATNAYSDVPWSGTWTRQNYLDFCDSSNKGGYWNDQPRTCSMLGVANSFDAAYAMGVSYCASQSYKLIDNNGNPYYYGGKNGPKYGGNYDSISKINHACFDSEISVSSPDKGVGVVKYIGYVPITLQEFIDEAEPEADGDPGDWVKTSEVEPDGEPTVTVIGGAVAQTNPYTDPKDGKPKQTRWDFDDTDGDGDADTVRETTIDRPDLPPNSPEAPELKPPTDTDTGDGTGTGDNTGDDEPKSDSASQPPFDLCKEHPEILACQKMGEVGDGFFDEIKIPKVTDERTWEEDRFLPSNGTCPAPKVFHVWGKPFQVSYEPLCSLMQQVRFIILIAFIVMSAYLVFGSLFRKD